MVRNSNPNRDYTKIRNEALNDPRLSFRAKGLLAYLLGKPADWTISERHLQNVTKEGGTAIRSMLKELETAGYLTRERKRGSDGLFTWECVLSDTSAIVLSAECEEKPRAEEPCVDNPRVDEPQVDRPYVVNRAVDIKELVITDQQNTHTRAAVPAVAVVGSNIPAYESETVTVTPAKRVRPSKYLPKGLHLIGGHIALGTGQNAVQVYYERFRPDLDRLTDVQEDDLIRNCPDLAKLREVVIAYSQAGYRSCNVKLILDWYRNGIPQHNKPDRPSRRDLQQYNKQTRTTNRPPAPNRGNDNAQTTTPSFDQHDLRPDIAEAIDKLYAGIPTRHDRAAD